MSKSVKQCKKISRIYIKKEANIKKYQGYIKKEVNIKKINNISWRGQIYNMNNTYLRLYLKGDKSPYPVTRSF